MTADKMPGVSHGVRQSTLARLWNVSRQTVSRYVAQGMPLDSVEAAEAWRLRIKGKGGAGGEGMASNHNSSTAKGDAPEVVNDKGIEAMLVRVRETEWRIWQCLQAGGTFEEQRNLLRLHKEAAATRLKVEQEAVDLQQKSGRLVDMSEAKTHVRAALAPLAVGLRAMGSRISLKCNPGRPEMAERVIDEEVQRLLSNFAEVMK